MTLVVGFDTETTGLKAAKGDRIIEFAAVGFDLDTQKRLFSYEKRVQPNRLIDPKAQLINKITPADLVGAPEFDKVEPMISAIFKKADIAVAHNLLFDVEFLLMEYSRIGKQLPEVQGFDTMDEGRWATSFGKNPNLGELCYACEVGYDSSLAHAALYDVEKMMKCFFFGLKYGGYSLEGILK